MLLLMRFLVELLENFVYDCLGISEASYQTQKDDVLYEVYASFFSI